MAVSEEPVRRLVLRESEFTICVTVTLVTWSISVVPHFSYRNGWDMRKYRQPWIPTPISIQTSSRNWLPWWNQHTTRNREKYQKQPDTMFFVKCTATSEWIIKCKISAWTCFLPPIMSLLTTLIFQQVLWKDYTWIISILQFTIRQRILLKSSLEKN